MGLKPVRGRVSTAPRASAWGFLGTIGPLTRTVADSALVYDVISGALDSDRYAATPPAEPFSVSAGREPNALRIGWLAAPAPGPVRVEPEVERSVRDLADLLARAGHDVRRIDGRWPEATPSFLPQFFAAIRECTTLVEHPERLEWRTRSTARAGVWARGPVVEAALRGAENLRARMLERFADFDLLLSPTIACLPPALGRLDGMGSHHALIRSLPMVAFTALANATGLPALSLPGLPSREGLPIGVQLQGLDEDEGRLLAIAAQVERLRPWPLIAPEPVGA